MVKWPVLLLEVAVLSAVVIGGFAWYNRPDPLAVWHKAGATPYDAGCTTIVCAGQKADENETPKDGPVTAPVTAPVQPAPSTAAMETNSAANPTEAAPMPPKETVSRTPIRRHRTRPRATIRTRRPAINSEWCDNLRSIAGGYSRDFVVRMARDRGYTEAQIRDALTCLGK